MTTTNARAECVPDIWKKGLDMRSGSDLSEVLEWSEPYFGKTERVEGVTGHIWTKSTDNRPMIEPRQEAVLSISNVPSVAWGGWPDRGIPELASPLAD